MLASALGVPFTYSTPLRELDASGLLPISYPIPKLLLADLRGRRVAVANDVVSAGSAVRGTLTALRECGAEPVATQHGVVLETLAAFPSELWEPAACPLCAARLALDSA